MFVTCFYAILDPRRGSLRYAHAGHDLPYLHRRGGGDDAEELRARRMPLGLMPGMSYEEKKVVVDAGESVLFYSDGLVEAHDPQGEMFGFPRLRVLVAKHGEEGSLGDFLLEELHSFVGEGWEQEDDITLLTLQRSRARSWTSENSYLLGTSVNKHNLTAVVPTQMLGFRKNMEALCDGHAPHPSISARWYRHGYRCHLDGLGRQASGAAYRTEPHRAERAVTPQPRSGPATEDGGSLR
jgi:hypothetical protein